MTSSCNEPVIMSTFFVEDSMNGKTSFVRYEDYRKENISYFLEYSH